MKSALLHTSRYTTPVLVTLKIPMATKYNKQRKREESHRDGKY